MTSPEHTDLELFSLIADGDEYAFKKLVVLYGSQIKPVILEIVKDPQHTRDIAQEVFLHLWLGREKLKTVQEPRSWIFRIVYYQALSWLRQKKVRSTAGYPITDEMQIPSTEFSPEEMYTFHQTTGWLREAIQQLSPQAKKIYLLSRNEGLKPAEIAKKLNLSVQTVKNILHRAIKFIREYLSQKGVWLPMSLFIFSYF